MGSRVHPSRSRTGWARSSSGTSVPRSAVWTPCRPPVERWWCPTIPAACSPPMCWSSRPRSTTSSALTGPSTHWLTTGSSSGRSRRVAAPRRCHRGQPRERRQGAAMRRGRVGVPWRGLRLVPADLHRERDRLRRPHRLCQNRDRDRRADRADGVDRCAGNPVVPCPRRFVGQAAGSDAGAHGDPADQHSGSRSGFQRVLPAEPATAHQDRHAGCSNRSTWRRSSARIPTSRRSTSMSAP